ncbi:hypothetical protein JAAARDRAFT_198347 [Jaapia argillacea MUCL 33604]|uniref:Uncharacterized protein n=1 Tax=Jaapia argillacea MUCL 33604 TaxID=933084 RepID=A0A067PF46_9AGAM|nr:hypothetical protein JAAARDRAFT_198347 [Jaapia argillacea MUCL 33604]
MSSPVALILGAGSGIGQSVAKTLKGKGYKVALASRTPSTDDEFFHLTVDLTHLESIDAVFKSVEKELGAPPNVVVYNAALFKPLPVPNDPLSLPLSEFEDNLKLGAGVFPAAQSALSGFRRLPGDLPKVFINTGNILPFIPAVPSYFGLGIQKKLESHLVELFDAAYRKDGFRFYFASQVNAEGGIPGPEFNPAIHGHVYWEVIQSKDLPGWDLR